MHWALRRFLLTLVAVSLIGGLPSLASAQEITVFGSENSTNNNSNYAKVNRYDVTSDVNLDQFEIRYRTYAANRDAIFAVWQADVNGVFQMIWQEAVTLNSYGWAWRAVTPDILLEAGETYAVGMWMDDNIYYAYDTTVAAPNGQPSWGTITAYRSLYSTTFPSSIGTSYWFITAAYYQRLTVSYAVDDDGDGFFSDVDCDDTNPNIFPGAIEACDGVDTDCDGLLRPDEFDLDGDGVSECEGDCDDTDPTTYLGAAETCDGLDNNCDGATDEGLTEDGDGDGFSSMGSCEGTADDCDDDDAGINPNALEAPCDGVDTDCDGNLHPDEADGDGDGVTVCDGDCDDSDGSVNPNASESCNGIDDNCDEAIDEGLTLDGDGDGFTSLSSCQGSSDDCDDADPTVYPGAVEVCNGIDDNCDGEIDEGLTFDVDGDNHTSLDSCGGSGDDCDDENDTIFPGAPELCDQLDNDCDGELPDAEIDADADGYAPCDGDCDDTLDSVWPGATEDCANGIDDNCNGVIDEATDQDGDGFTCDDCDDTNDAIFPGAEELACDGVDTDCDGELHPDESDSDGDGVTVCDGDCDDANPEAFPGAKEDICDEVDIDCDGELPTREGCDPPDGDDDDGGGTGSLVGSGCQGCDSSVEEAADSPRSLVGLLMILATLRRRRRA